MKAPRYLAVCLLVCAALAVRATAQSFDDLTRQALQVAARDFQEAIGRAGLPTDQPCVILPIAGDREAYFEGLLKNALTAAGLTCIEAKHDPALQKLLEELAWNERKQDMLDPATLTTLGRWKAAQIVIYGTLRDTVANADHAFVEAELHASSLATKQHLWGQTFAARIYAAGTLQGLVSFDDISRALLRQICSQLVVSVRSAPRLQNVRAIAVLPLGGDIDGYITGLAQDALSQAGFVLKDINLRTRAEAASILRGQQPLADALFYGAVRDLARRVVKDDPRETVVRTSAELQLRIQAAGSDEIIWSDTLSASLDSTQAKPAPPSSTDKFLDYLREHPRVAVIGLLCVAGLLVLIIIVRAATRVR